jgi:hypothetical protein
MDGCKFIVKELGGLVDASPVLIQQEKWVIRGQEERENLGCGIPFRKEPEVGCNSRIFISFLAVRPDIHWRGWPK